MPCNSGKKQQETAAQLLRVASRLAPGLLRIYFAPLLRTLLTLLRETSPPSAAELLLTLAELISVTSAAELDRHVELYGDEAPTERAVLASRVKEMAGVAARDAEACRAVAEETAAFFRDREGVLPEAAQLAIARAFHAALEAEPPGTAFHKLFSRYSLAPRDDRDGSPN